MKPTNGERLKTILEHVSNRLESAKDELCALDSETGDGDHGVAITIGMRAIRRALRELDSPSPEAVWRSAAEAFADDVGASIGPLYEAAFTAAAEASTGKATLDTLADWARIITAMNWAIQRTGKASLGDKTMVDAWDPAANAIQLALERHQSLETGLSNAASAAHAGAEGTKGMLPRLGRASRLGERAQAFQDAGATSAAMFIESLGEAINTV